MDSRKSSPFYSYCAVESCQNKQAGQGLCIKHYQYVWHRNNRAHRRQQRKARHEARRAEENANNAAWRAANRERSREILREHYRNNKSNYIAKDAARRAQKIKATPKWVNRLALKRIYRDCPPGFHVDHIVPLKGKNVCGLHVPWNLQYLPAIENIKKGNRYEAA